MALAFLPQAEREPGDPCETHRPSHPFGLRGALRKGLRKFQPLLVTDHYEIEVLNVVLPARLDLHNASVILLIKSLDFALCLAVVPPPLRRRFDHDGAEPRARLSFDVHETSAMLIDLARDEVGSDI